MKKTLLLLASAALLLVGCAKDNPGSDTGSGEMVTASFTAQMQGMPQTKTVTDGQGTKANRCVMEIYYKGVLYTREVKSIADMKATFAPRLVSNRTYDVLFWADCGEGLNDKYYKTDAEGGLQAVEMMATTYDANDDARDAFFINKKVEVKQQVSSEIFSLTRPFSQVNIITTDAADIKNANLYPDGVKMVYKAPTKFNLLTGELSETKELTVTGTPYEAFKATSTALTLEMDYLFAGEEKSALDIAFEASKTGETAITKHSFTNIPVQRNYRTNIKGALLTTTGNWTAEITPAWDGEENVPVAEVGSVAAANEAFANGATNVKITSVGEVTILYLPETTEKVTIDFANPDKVVTVNYRPAAAPTNAPAPTTKAAVEGVQPSVVNIATNDVTKFVVTGISNVVWLVGNQAALVNALNNAAPAHTVALSSDITMTDKWISVRRGDKTPNFDGRNHVISNMTIETEEDAYVGLFSQITNRVTLQNVTFKNAKLKIPESVGEHARGGVLVGHAYPINVYNCHVEGAEIVGCQKLGGLIGYIEGDAANATVTVKDCSVKDVKIISNRPGNYFEHGVGGFIGHISLSQANLITIENNSIENVTITGNKPMENYTNAFLQLVPHVFIGNVCNSYTGADASSISVHSVVLKNNSISGTNTTLPTCIYSSEYFGWGGNADERPAWKGKIYIDGEEWTPNYPFKNVTTGKGYVTLDAALTALKASETLEIWQAGEYTVETLKSPANSTIDAKVEGVVFNHTAAGSSWIASDAISGRTVKNITWNIGNANYQALHVDNLIGCTINGRFYPHVAATFTDCVFNAPGYEYCLWTWNSDATFNSCIFNTQGKAVNVYGNSTNTYTFENCVFNATNIPTGKGKAAIFVKDGVDKDNQNAKINVIIKNCTANYDRPYNQLDPGDVQYSESVLWNVEIGKEPYYGTNEITISVDGEKVYPFTKFSVSDAAGLRNAIKMFNKGKEQVEYSIELADGTYEVSDMPIIQAAKKSLVVKAKNEGKAILTPDAGTKTNQVFLISGGGLTNTGDEWVTFEGLKFNMPNDPGKITSAILCTAKNDATYSPLVGESMTWYAHNITVRNCELQGCGTENSSLLKAAGGAGANIVLVDNCVVNHSGYVVSDYFSNVRIVNTKVTDTKACANIANVGITVEGCNISTYHDYCIRTNGGAVVVKDNTFTMTYDGAATDAGIVVLRGTGDQASISGNTITKAVNTMWDCYCKTAWTVNGEAKAAGTGINF